MYNYEISIEHLPFWSEQCRFNKYKNYIFVTGGPNLSIRIYDIIDQYNPKLIMYFEKTIDCNMGFAFHGCVTLPQPPQPPNANCYVTSGNNCDNNNNNIVRLLVFGGYVDSFVKSFHQIDINFDKLISELDKQNNTQQREKNVKILANIENSRIQTYGPFTYHNYQINTQYKDIIQVHGGSDDYGLMSKMLNLDTLVSVGEKNGLQFCDNKHKYGIFGCSMYNSRHLLIYDAFCPCDRLGLNTIINFDFCTKKWTIYNNVWQDKGIWRKGCILKEPHGGDGMWLETMGGVCTQPEMSDDGEITSQHCKIKLCRNLDWCIERLLWIGYIKNNTKTRLCKLAILPKDIILYIICFFKNQFIFDRW